MKKLLLGTAVLVALAGGSAAAADLPVKAPPMVAGFDWTGPYIGANGGYSWGRSETDYRIESSLVPTSQNLNGWLGGGQAGYNWQVDRHWVFGIEADLQATGQEGLQALPGSSACFTAFVAGAAGTDCVTTTGNLAQKLPWVGTARARLGFLPTDRWMVYGTGGFAFGEVDTDAASSATFLTTINGVPISTVSRNSAAASSVTKGGWTAGGGTEWAIAGAWSVKLEYLYVDLGHVTASTRLVPPFTTTSHVTDNIVRVGLNYRFGGPVVAKY
jgi:outer membrane immunogenic protein